jgi:NADH-quinone oxidoreductase subunit A
MAGELALLLHAALAIVVLLMVLFLARLVRARGATTKLAATDIYESGMPTVAPHVAPVRAPLVFLAIAFILFDLEVILLAAWAVAARALGLSGLVPAAIFILVLGAALLYLWKDGALDVGPGDRG